MVQLIQHGGAKPRRIIAAHDRAAWSVATTPNGRFALSAGTDERVRVWHLETGDRIGIEIGGASAPEILPARDHPGSLVFRKCARCHALGPDGRQRSGPHFAGLFGRAAGSLPGYKYSPALQHANLVWSDETIRELFRLGPDNYIPGTKMPMQQITDERQLSHLIAYLLKVLPPSK